MLEEEVKNVDPAKGFVDKETIDMKIYDADKSDAIWLKQFCDLQGIKFNSGLKLIRRIVEEHEFKIMMASSINELDGRLCRVEAVLNDSNKPKEEAPKVASVSRKPVVFGSKRGVKQDG